VKVSFDIDSYKTKFLGGAKAYLFFALFTFPNSMGIQTSSNSSIMDQMLSPFGYKAGSNVVPYLVKSTSIPDSSFEEITVSYPGIPFKMAGSRSYGDWTVSFNVDEEGTLLNSFNLWHDIIYDPKYNKPGEPATYMATQQLFLLNGAGESTRSYNLVNAWPKSIGAVSLDYSSTDIATVDVTFAYQYFTTTIENAGNGAANTLMKSLLNKITGSAFR